MADRTQKDLPKAQRRFEARVWEKKNWRVYDHARGSWPVDTPWTGNVPEAMTEAQAKTFADRLEEQRG